MPQSRPNVLLICTDHWAGQVLGCEGHPAVQTPTLDQLAANGVRYCHTYSECPVCVPARRTLMTGLTAATHGLLNNGHTPFPEVTTLAQAFRDGGYQAYAVGKLHVSPQRRRLGFDDVVLDEEGRAKEGVGADDYELFLGDQGFPGQRFAGGMCNNLYMWRAWHLDERLHVTNWAAQQMCRTIRRRDPLKPAFWYLSFSHPHPPLHPLQAYLDLYREFEPEPAVCGDWMHEDAPPVLRQRARAHPDQNAAQVRAIRKAYYALCTHIDHQLRVVLGTLREEGLLTNTIIAFTSDHGDMLGDHGMWAKSLMYDRAARVPLLVTGVQGDARMPAGKVDSRLAGLADVMPTLLDLAGVPIPRHVEGLSLVGAKQREACYSVFGGVEGASATRMVRDSRYKLIYYPAGNVRQLFDMQEDPQELHDLAGDTGRRAVLAQLTETLVERLTVAEQQRWLSNGALTGLPAPALSSSRASAGHHGQRGTHWPPPTTGEAVW